MKLKETLKPLSGKVHLDIFEGGKLVKTLKGNNLIMLNLSVLIAQAMSGATSANVITQIKFGTGTTAPVNTETELEGLVLAKNIDTAVFPGSPASLVRFNFSILDSEANGNTITEIGLFTADDVMVARRVLEESFTKTSNMTVEGSWDIQF